MATRTLKLSLVMATVTLGRVPAPGEELRYTGRYWRVSRVDRELDLITLED